MTDVVVTLPKTFGLKRWIEEGDPAGTEWSGEEWGWYMRGNPPRTLEVGERVYVVYDSQLIGYSPLVRIERAFGGYGFCLVRRGGAVACTIPCKIKGFQGYRYRWWDRSAEVPFPDWHRGLTNAAT